MKQLTCEMCGGTDLVKDGGVFICQTCGCKYSVEEAKKMMVEGTVEVAGTVKIDRSAEQQQLIDNYLSMCENASDAMDTATVVEYSDKVLEMEPNNYKAWMYRALSCGWNSSLNDMKTGQVITAAKKAIEVAPEEEKAALAEKIYIQGKLQILSHLKRAFSMPSTLTSTWREEAIHKVMYAWIQLLGIPCLSAEKMEAEIADCVALEKNNSYKMNVAIAIANGKKPYSDTMRATLETKIEEAKKLDETRKSEYWEAHAEEKARLELRKESAKRRIEELEREISQIPEAIQKKEINDKISGLTNQMNSLGMFKGKEKKALQTQIDDIKTSLAPIESALKEKKAEIQAKIDEQNGIIREVEVELTKKR